MAQRRGLAVSAIVDLMLHYEIAQTGIDPGDTTACLTGQTAGGIGIYGCDVVRTH